MKKLGIGLLFLSLIFTTAHCNRSTAKSKVEDSSIEKNEQLNEREKEIIREGELFNDSIDLLEEIFYEDSGDLK